MKRYPRKSGAMIKADEAMQDWRQAVYRARPNQNADHIRTVCNSIIVRARKLADESAIDFNEVAAFLLMKSRDWCLGGLPVGNVVAKLPTNLRELGIMKMAEDGDEVQRVMGNPQ